MCTRILIKDFVSVAQGVIYPYQMRRGQDLGRKAIRQRVNIEKDQKNIDLEVVHPVGTTKRAIKGKATHDQGVAHLLVNPEKGRTFLMKL